MRTSTRLLATAVLPGALLFTACGNDADEVTSAVQTAVAAHSGAWSDEELRAAAGEFSDDVVDTEIVGADGGVITVELRESGGTKVSSNGSSSRSAYKVECLTLTIEGKTVTPETYSAKSTTTRPSC